MSYDDDEDAEWLDYLLYKIADRHECDLVEAYEIYCDTPARELRREYQLGRTEGLI